MGKRRTFSLSSKEAGLDFISPLITERLKDLPSRIGLDELWVKGSSALPLPKGEFRSKIVLQKKPDATGWIWQLMGEQTDLTKRIRQFPDTTVMLAHYAINAPMLYAELQKELAPFPEASKAMEKAISQLKDIGFPLDELLHSIKQGISYGLSLNEQNTWVIPTPQGPVTMPEAGWSVILPDERVGSSRFKILIQDMGSSNFSSACSRCARDFSR